MLRITLLMIMICPLMDILSTNRIRTALIALLVPILLTADAITVNSVPAIGDIAGSRDCHSCKEIENACSTSAPEDQVKCAKPSVVYTAVKCLYANVKCEYADHYNVRLETPSGQVLAIGEQSETVAKCRNGK
ncbi:unnamed protein product [Haemonchus placei]|uniref:Secreted protein n=1 Tax=Haemonchus placei TaxID=6290 RepID=A0A0N4W908_HAEPC|nr:unnamed protein product [Haemonchus placei]